MSSLAKRYRIGRAGRPDRGDLMPPDLRTLGDVPFGSNERARLAAWLREGAWPRGHMEMAELEGYLLAMIVWPVTISAGAWLPPIWGERGWRVPTKLAVQSRYEEFVGLIVGYMRELDRQLGQRLDASVLRNLEDDRRAADLHSWGKGFMTALTLGSQGLKWRSASACAAVRIIAGHTRATSPFGPRAVEEVLGAVIGLMEQRPSRGPLGALPMR